MATGYAGMYIPIKGKVELKIPNGGRWVRPWLKGLGVRGPQWDRANGVWTVPRSRWSKVLEAMIDRYDYVLLIKDSKVSERIACAVACQDARGVDCECSCGGEFHGGGGQWSWTNGEALVNWHTTWARTSRWVYESKIEEYPIEEGGSSE